MKLDAKNILEVVEIQAIEKEMDVLRDQYFYDVKHEDFNALYYEFLEATNKDGLSTSEKLSICEGFFLKAVEYMNLAEEMPKQPGPSKTSKSKHKNEPTGEPFVC